MRTYYSAQIFMELISLKLEKKLYFQKKKKRDKTAS